MERKRQRFNKVVLVPLPLQGHITPMLQLGTILHSKGFSITVIHTKFNSPDPSKYPEFSFLSIPDNLSDQVISSGNTISLIFEINMNCQAPFLECLVRMTEQQKLHDEIACIIYDELMYFSDTAVARMKLPSITFCTTSAATFNARLDLLQLKEEGYLPFQDAALQDLVPGLHPLRFKDLPLSRFGATEDLFQLMSNLKARKTSSAFVINTVDILEKSLLLQVQQQVQGPVFPIGPLHLVAPASSSSLLEEDGSCITWLDKQSRNSVIYVSLGSLVLVEENEVAEMAWGLANSKQPFLWVIRPGLVINSQRKELLPEGFQETVGENGYIVKWAPQKEVLAHDSVGGFWTHCGWNSTMESLSQGVPMICRPSSGDQRVNARYIGHVWRVGLELNDKLERVEIERAVRRLMGAKEGGEMRQRAINLKEKIELCIGEGGSSYNSSSELEKLIMSFTPES
ncbi:hypothetical protein SLE2022_195500 [Rubroshorea leprosula]